MRLRERQPINLKKTQMKNNSDCSGAFESVFRIIHQQYCLCERTIAQEILLQIAEQNTQQKEGKTS
jgi:hypothetical protein